MSSSKAKKKSKSAKIPEPIKIKREDDHIICPMEHYVDDRVELIRQIFSSLKPKTITNLAPEFLKKSKLEDIQQECLNEILGISKKRLLSIINSTKCPTDTDSSSEDDVNAVAEHVSLEEISSDSDVAGSKGIKGAGKKKKKIKTEGDNNKQFSVLELLELQARARAIRSQLALEPVTKIEVDTDSEEDGPPKQKPPSAMAAARKKAIKSANDRLKSTQSDATKKSTPSTLTVILPNGEPVPTKRIKLKRNFRKQTRDVDSEDDVQAIDEDDQPKAEKIVPKKEARSPSPDDVIPIVPVPETLCISDSEEEKKNEKVQEKENEQIEEKNNEKLDEEKNEVVEEKKEDELAASNDAVTSTIASESSQPVEILSVVNIEAPKKPENETNKLETSITSPQKENAPKEKVPEESEEEGEIRDDVQEEVRDITSKESASDKQETAPKKCSSITIINDDEIPNKEVEKEEPTPSPPTEEKKKKCVDPIKKEKTPEELNEKPQIVDASEDEDDDNDDVISLEGEDVVNEMKEHMEDVVEDVKPQHDVICLDDSSDEETKKKPESWNDRWLNSRRVSKVLATSRLGNKVRNKVKESKKAKRLKDAAASEKEKEKPQQVIFVSKHEMGSVEQYKELLEKLPKKSTG